MMAGGKLEAGSNIASSKRAVLCHLRDKVLITDILETKIRHEEHQPQEIRETLVLKWKRGGSLTSGRRRLSSNASYVPAQLLPVLLHGSAQFP